MDIREAVKEAVSLNLAGIVITDHYDYDVPSGVSDFKFNPLDQQTEISKIQNEIISGELGINNSDFKLLKGIELGLQSKSLDKASSFMKEHHFDTVITSQHFIDEMDPYNRTYYNYYQWKEAYQNYLEVFYNNICKFENFDILGHFDYVVRYAPYPQDITFKEFPEILDAILTKLVSRGQTFEINTKTYQYYNNKTPKLDPSILKRYAALGGIGISFGSDAHSPNRLSENFKYFREFTINCGIKNEIYYKNREALFIKL